MIKKQMDELMRRSEAKNGAPKNLFVLMVVLALTLACPTCRGADDSLGKRLFPVDLPEMEWRDFPAAGFSQPVSGLLSVIGGTIP